MRVLTGNIWNEVGRASLILVTTNSYVKQDGSLVMGKGAALEAKSRYPQLPFYLGKEVSRLRAIGGEYLIIKGFQPNNTRTEVGALQVKRHWNEDADIQLIARSIGELIEIAPDYKRIAINFPGIGAGGLALNSVLPYLEELPANVFVYRKPM